MYDVCISGRAFSLQQVVSAVLQGAGEAGPSTPLPRLTSSMMCMYGLCLAYKLEQVVSAVLLGTGEKEAGLGISL